MLEERLEELEIKVSRRLEMQEKMRSILYRLREELDMAEDWDEVERLKECIRETEYHMREMGGYASIAITEKRSIEKRLREAELEAARAQFSDSDEYVP